MIHEFPSIYYDQSQMSYVESSMIQGMSAAIFPTLANLYFIVFYLWYFVVVFFNSSLHSLDC